MSTGQTRTYPFWERKRPLVSALCTLHYCTLCLSLVSSPNHPTLSPLKTLSTSRQPTFWTACCYRRTFPPSISRMTVFNAIWKIPSERLDDGSGFNCFRLLWGGWLIRTLLVFVLIVSSRISRNKCVMSDTKACYEHWADADISFLRKEKTAWCLPALFYMAPLHFAFLCAIISRPPSPCFRLKTLSISRQPTLMVACCYRRTFPPVFLKWQSSTPFERYFQKGLMMAVA